MRYAIALILLLGSNAAWAASYTPPPNAPQVYLPNYGVTVGVWAAQTGVGHGIGIFEKSGTNPWTLCGQCIISPGYPTLDSDVAAAGGAGPYVAGKLADVNAVLSIRYPQIGAEPAGTTLDKVNGSLAGYVLRLVNGSPQIGPK